MISDKKKQQYISEFVYGSIDGTVTTFAIVSGVMGAGLSSGIILVLGSASVLADGFSMAAGDYLSEQSEQAVTGEDTGKRPVSAALVTFASFVLIGVIPLLPFVFAIKSDFFAQNQFMASIVMTSLAFVWIGFMRGKIANANKIFTAMQTLFVGGSAALISYGVGVLLQNLGGM